jgi:hypothetical protein
MVIITRLVHAPPMECSIMIMGVASTFNQWRHMQVHDEDVAVVHYVGVLKDICLVNYGPISSPIVLVWCEWCGMGLT